MMPKSVKRFSDNASCSKIRSITFMILGRVYRPRSSAILLEPRRAHAGSGCGGGSGSLTHAVEDREAAEHLARRRQGRIRHGGVALCRRVNGAAIDRRESRPRLRRGYRSAACRARASIG